MFKNFIIYLIHNWIAIISLGISLFALWKSRKKLIVSMPENILLNLPNSTFAVTADGSPNGYEHTAMVTIEVVNPSPSDIGYFDLRVFDPKTNSNIDYITEKSLPTNLVNKDVYQMIDWKTQKYYKLDLPKRKFGTFKANSFTTLDVVIVLSNLPKEIETLSQIGVSFKVAKRTFIKKDNFSMTNRKIFKFYGTIYDVNGYQEKLKQLQQKQDVELTNLTQQKSTIKPQE